MKFKELLEVGKFEEYHLGVKSFTKEEIEKDYRHFLEQNVTSIVPRAYTVRKFIDKKLYTIVLVDAFVYLDTLNSGEVGGSLSESYSK